MKNKIKMIPVKEEVKFDLGELKSRREKQDTKSYSWSTFMSILMAVYMEKVEQVQKEESKKEFNFNKLGE